MPISADLWLVMLVMLCGIFILQRKVRKANDAGIE
jgi:hypothetical protein